MTSDAVDEWERPAPGRISQLPTTAKDFAEVVEALRQGTVRHVFGPVPKAQLPMAAAGLRTAGLSFSEIADTLGLCTVPLALQTEHDLQVAADRARKLTAEGLAILVSSDDTSREHLRRQASEQLNTLLSTIWAKATDPEHALQLTASKRAAELIEQHTKLWGLNAPVEHVIHTPGNDRIAELIREVNKSVEVEADPFEYDDIEDAVVVSEQDVL